MNFPHFRFLFRVFKSALCIFLRFALMTCCSADACGWVFAGGECYRRSREEAGRIRLRRPSNIGGRSRYGKTLRTIHGNTSPFQGRRTGAAFVCEADDNASVGWALIRNERVASLWRRAASHHQKLSRPKAKDESRKINAGQPNIQHHIFNRHNTWKRIST